MLGFLEMLIEDLTHVNGAKNVIGMSVDDFYPTVL